MALFNIGAGALTFNDERTTIKRLFFEANGPLSGSSDKYTFYYENGAGKKTSIRPFNGDYKTLKQHNGRADAVEFVDENGKKEVMYVTADGVSYNAEEGFTRMSFDLNRYIIKDGLIQPVIIENTNSNGFGLLSNKGSKEDVEKGIKALAQMQADYVVFKKADSNNQLEKLIISGANYLRVYDDAEVEISRLGYNIDCNGADANTVSDAFDKAVASQVTEVKNKIIVAYEKAARRFPESAAIAIGAEAYKAAGGKEKIKVSDAAKEAAEHIDDQEIDTKYSLDSPLEIKFVSAENGSGLLSRRSFKQEDINEFLTADSLYMQIISNPNENVQELTETLRNCAKYIEITEDYVDIDNSALYCVATAVNSDETDFDQIEKELRKAISNRLKRVKKILISAYKALIDADKNNAALAEFNEVYRQLTHDTYKPSEDAIKNFENQNDEDDDDTELKDELNDTEDDEDSDEDLEEEEEEDEEEEEIEELTDEEVNEKLQKLKQAQERAAKYIQADSANNEPQSLVNPKTVGLVTLFFFPAFFFMTKKSKGLSGKGFLFTILWILILLTATSTSLPFILALIFQIAFGIYIMTMSPEKFNTKFINSNN